jgi:hypothetical protein
MATPLPPPVWGDEKFITATRGITHTPLFNLRKAGKIRSLSLRVDGAKYGKRLYHIPTIDAFLASLEARDIQTEAAAGQAKQGGAR